MRQRPERWSFEAGGAADRLLGSAAGGARWGDSRERSERVARAMGNAQARQFAGPRATETFVHGGAPAGSGESVEDQVRAAYGQIHRALTEERQSLPSVIREIVFFRDIAKDLDPYLEARLEVLQRLGLSNAYQPVSTFIQQPPLEDHARFEILLTAVTPHPSTEAKVWDAQEAAMGAQPLCLRGSCAGSEARVILLGGEKHLFAGNMYGEPGDAYDEALSMFRGAREMLRREGLDFTSVARTWIYFRHMWRDYAGFNRARRDFFREAGVGVRPASTGINGSPFPPECNLCMGLHAVESPGAPPFEIMTTPTLNEAWEYGSDFSRGLRVVDANKTTLYVSGTASINEQGETVHIDDFEGQVERTLLNISELLDHQGASLDDIVSAISYVKRRRDAPKFFEVLSRKSFGGFPNATVEAGVCRENLLVEIEVTALLPR
ncbi:MAG: hypothetical protein JXA90_01820 [Planctomycetes bacterium]|nr:hypothetical protein [Planctomycetota bacterium]